MKKILIIEDDTVLNDTLSYRLKKENYKITSAYNAMEALKKIRKESFELIILDVNLPDGNGFELISKLKSFHNSAIIFLTANDLEADMLQGFDLGADDYITKPFSINILQRKIGALMNRLKEQELEQQFNDGYFKINFRKLEASLNGKPIEFTPLEYRTLELFCINTHKILTRQTIFEKLWDSSGNFVEESSLNAIVSRIRSKIESENYHYIKTIYGIGYMWIGENNE